MRSQYTLLHIETVLNVYTFIYNTFSVVSWGNKLSSEKILHHVCFWHQPSFDICIVILLPDTNEFFSPRPLAKKIQSSWHMLSRDRIPSTAADQIVRMRMQAPRLYNFFHAHQLRMKIYHDHKC